VDNEVHKPLEIKSDEKLVIFPSQPRMTIEEFKDIVKSLGGDTGWIDRIDERLSQLDKEIRELQERINKLRTEKERLLSLKNVLGLS